jgi:hypothetical protein
MAEYHIINLNDTMIKCFSDGRIFTLFKNSNKYGKKGEWIERQSKPDTYGYIHISIGKKHYFAHRLIMLAFVGESDQQVDHINRIKTDNRFENLRYCTRSENQLNRESVDKAKGYYWHKDRNKWEARIRINNKQKYLGRFDKEEDAHQAYLDARLKYHNEL